MPRCENNKKMSSTINQNQFIYNLLLSSGTVIKKMSNRNLDEDDEFKVKEFTKPRESVLGQSHI